jgi:hypothetical protein
MNNAEAYHVCIQPHRIHTICCDKIALTYQPAFTIVLLRKSK